MFGVVAALYKAVSLLEVLLGVQQEKSSATRFWGFAQQDLCGPDEVSGPAQYSPGAGPGCP